MSISPGMSQRPRPSIRSEPRGTRVEDLGPTASIRSPRTTTFWCSRTRSESMGTTLTSTKTRGRKPGASCRPAAAGDADTSHTTPRATPTLATVRRTELTRVTRDLLIQRHLDHRRTPLRAPRATTPYQYRPRLTGKAAAWEVQ